MIDVSKAASLIAEHQLTPRTESVSLLESIGHVLAEPVIAERDGPPFHRVMMDGIALKYDKICNGHKSFQIVGTQAAGEPQMTLDGDCTCLEIMTGAVLPNNCDLVIPYENLKIEAGEASIITKDTYKPMDNVHLKGSDFQVDEVLVKAGKRISPAMIGTAASNGYAKLKVQPFPKIALISTGDELVEIDKKPLPHQIHRSNSYAMKAMFLDVGLNQVEMFHLEDNAEKIFDNLQSILSEYQLVVLSGGVSKGKFDYLPQALSDLSVEKIFHGVTQRPGKPLWFGRRQGGPLVFGLPGNPVSSMVCLRRYVLPMLVDMQVSPVKLKEDIVFNQNLTLFKPVSVEFDLDGQLWAKPIAIQNSGDYQALNGSSGFVELPRSGTEFKAGEIVNYFSWSGSRG